MPQLVAYGLSCLLPAVLAFVIERIALRVPFEDEWEWAPLIYAAHAGTLQFASLWAQHNEHRIFFPQLIMLGLAMLGGWSQVRETLFSLLLVVLTQIGLFVLLRRILAAPRLAYTFLAVSLLLYSLAQIENWDWGFQMAWFLCNFCAVWSVVFLGARGQSWFALAAAALLAAVASFSSSQGLMVWPAGITVLALTEKRLPPQLIAWVVVAAAAFALYFHGFMHPAQPAPPTLALHHPLTAARYYGAYVGQIFTGWLGFWPAVIAGWAGLGTLAALGTVFVHDFRTDRASAARCGPFVGLAVYALATAAITMVGRLGFGEEQAQASRYTSIAIYVWIAVIVFAVTYADRYRPRIPAGLWSLWPSGIILCAIAYGGACEAGYALGVGRLAEVQSALPSLVAGQGPGLGALYPSADTVERYLRELKSIDDGPYYE